MSTRVGMVKNYSPPLGGTTPQGGAFFCSPGSPEKSVEVKKWTN